MSCLFINTTHNNETQHRLYCHLPPPQNNTCPRDFQHFLEPSVRPSLTPNGVNGGVNRPVFSRCGCTPYTALSTTNYIVTYKQNIDYKQKPRGVAYKVHSCPRCEQMIVNHLNRKRISSHGLSQFQFGRGGVKVVFWCCSQ